MVNKQRVEPRVDKFRHSLGYVTVRVLWTVDVAAAYRDTQSFRKVRNDIAFDVPSYNQRAFGYK